MTLPGVVLLGGGILVTACSGGATTHVGASRAPGAAVGSSSPGADVATVPRLAPPAAMVPSAPIAPPAQPDRTPAPAVATTGTDYVAIARSISNYHGWLLAHRPDAALAPAVYLRGTKSFGEFVHNLDDLRAHHETLVSIGQHVTFTTASVVGPLVTLRVHEVIREDRCLDAQRHVVRVTPYPSPNDYVMVMTRDGTGHWHLVDITLVALDPTVIL